MKWTPSSYSDSQASADVSFLSASSSRCFSMVRCLEFCGARATAERTLPTDRFNSSI